MQDLGGGSPAVSITSDNTSIIFYGNRHIYQQILPTDSIGPTSHCSALGLAPTQGLLSRTIFFSMANVTAYRLHHTVVGLSYQLVNQADEKQALLDRTHALQIQNSVIQKEKECLARQTQDNLRETHRRVKQLDEQIKDMKRALNNIATLASSFKSEASANSKEFDFAEHILNQTQKYIRNKPAVSTVRLAPEPSSESATMEEGWTMSSDERLNDE
ncbi:hypothetical protein H2202_010974 [Exophiala xenobiotica]|nr:hypothetical protein H2202_010974 [Exophiala xenobiotica]